MSDRVIAFFVFMGIILAAGGVGGIEQSTTGHADDTSKGISLRLLRGLDPLARVEGTPRAFLF